MKELEDLRCTHCGIDLIVIDEPNVCLLCGEPLCSLCYDASPYCGRCDTAPTPRVMQCPNCGHDWTAHSAYIARGERMCVEALPDGYSLHIHYTDQNVLSSAQAYEGDLFVCQHVGARCIARCKASITKRIKAS